MVSLDNAPFVASSESFTASLEGAVDASQLALVIDVDALQRSRHARVDQTLLHILESLALTTHIALYSQTLSADAAALHRAMPFSSWEHGTVPAFAVADIRTRIPGVCCVAISDHVSVFRALGGTDRALALSAASPFTGAQVLYIGDLGLRPALSWLTDGRTSRRVLTCGS